MVVALFFLVSYSFSVYIFSLDWKLLEILCRENGLNFMIANESFKPNGMEGVSITFHGVGSSFCEDEKE